LLGFVCGEGYEWPEGDLAEALPGVDVVVISAHVEVNRIWEPAIDQGMKRWAFQRRFRFISQQAGAALAHARTHAGPTTATCAIATTGSCIAAKSRSPVHGLAIRSAEGRASNCTPPLEA
jgi:hypothetical protein